METLKTQNVFTGCVALPFEKKKNSNNSNANMNNFKSKKWTCIRSSVSTSVLCVQREAETLVHSAALLSAFSTLFFPDSLQRFSPHINDRIHLYSLQLHMKKHTTAFYKHPQLVPSHPCCQPSWQTQLLTAPSRRKNQPPSALFLFSLLNTSRVDSRVDFPPPNFPCPTQQCFGIWSLDGNVSIRVHTTHPVQMKVLSQGLLFAVESSSFGEVDDGHPLVQTATLSAEPTHFAQSRIVPCRGMWAL